MDLLRVTHSGYRGEGYREVGSRAHRRFVVPIKDLLGHTGEMLARRLDQILVDALCHGDLTAEDKRP